MRHIQFIDRAVDIPVVTETDTHRCSSWNRLLTYPLLCIS